MRFKTSVGIVAATLAFLAAYAPVFAQNSSIPSKLSGRWTTLDGSFSQTISLKLDLTAGKGELTVWSNAAGCSINNAPVTVTVQGDNIAAKVDASYSNPCRSDVSLEIVKKDGSNNYEGELRQGGDAGRQYPILKVKMSP